MEEWKFEFTDAKTFWIATVNTKRHSGWYATGKTKFKAASNLLTKIDDSPTDEWRNVEQAVIPVQEWIMKQLIAN